MAACGSFQRIFESSLPEAHHQSSSLIDSLSSSSSSSSSSSWKKHQIKPDQHSFTELFGELHFKENPIKLSSSSLSNQSSSNYSVRSSTSSNDGFCPIKYDNNSNSLHLCTEGLGFESLVDDLKDPKNDTTSCTNNNNNYNNKTSMDLDDNISPIKKPTQIVVESTSQYRISRDSGRTFPPPISCIGRTGKPWVLFESYRQDGRFVLQEVRIPSQEFLHASRHDGRLRLRFVQPDETYDDLTDDLEDEDSFEEEEECERVEEAEGGR